MAEILQYPPETQKRLDNLQQLLTEQLTERRTRSRPPIVIGVFGGVCTGKSTLVKLFANFCSKEVSRWEEGSPNQVFFLDADPGQVNLSFPGSICYLPMRRYDDKRSDGDELVNVSFSIDDLEMEFYGYKSPLHNPKYFQYKLRRLLSRLQVASKGGNDMAAVVVNTCGFFDDKPAEAIEHIDALLTLLQPTHALLIGDRPDDPVYHSSCFESTSTRRVHVLGANSFIREMSKQEREGKRMIMFFNFLVSPSVKYGTATLGMHCLQINRLKHNFVRFGTVWSDRVESVQADGNNIERFIPFTWLQPIPRELLNWVFIVTPHLSGELQRPCMSFYDTPIRGMVIPYAVNGLWLKCISSLNELPPGALLQRSHIRLTQQDVSLMTILDNDDDWSLLLGVIGEHNLDVAGAGDNIARPKFDSTPACQPPTALSSPPAVTDALPTPGYAQTATTGNVNATPSDTTGEEDFAGLPDTEIGGSSDLAVQSIDARVQDGGALRSSARIDGISEEACAGAAGVGPTVANDMNDGFSESSGSGSGISNRPRTAAGVTTRRRWAAAFRGSTEAALDNISNSTNAVGIEAYGSAANDVDMDTTVTSICPLAATSNRPVSRTMAEATAACEQVSGIDDGATSAPKDNQLEQTTSDSLRSTVTPSNSLVDAEDVGMEDTITGVTTRRQWKAQIETTHETLHVTTSDTPSIGSSSSRSEDGKRRRKTDSIGDRSDSPTSGHSVGLVSRKRIQRSSGKRQRKSAI